MGVRGSDQARLSQDVKIGESVHVRDSPEEQWRLAVVNAVDPVRATPVGWPGSNTFEWKYLEKPQSERPQVMEDFKIGDAVRVRDSIDESWRSAMITFLHPVRAQPDDWPGSASFEWKFL